jgi:hypothetical protein|tara:strand:- start:26436 stop:27665 length:1230 start_codon:yes stop_codon:yes gene_type:complete
MLSFKNYLAEAKNTHMEHLEDNILNNGVEGTRQSINFLRSLRDMLAGTAKSKVNVTVKWDGAPAVFAGIDPSDGKFFVAKKGIFNKNPKVYKTNKDIDDDTKGDLNTKLKLALAELPKLNIKGVVQGDFLYAKEDLKVVDIEGEPHITFHPNTIVYAVPQNSDLGRQILSSKIGVVWHTTYRGSSFEEMSASFGEEIASSLKKTKSVWSVDALYRDLSGTATLTKKETDEVTKILSAAGKKFNTIKKETLNGISQHEDTLVRVKTFVNSKIRQGERIKNPRKLSKELTQYIDNYYEKQAATRSTAKGKATQRGKKDATLQYFKRTPESQITAMFELYNLLIDAKHMLIGKLDRAKSIGTFLKTKDGYEVTKQEGFVAIDHMGKNAVKLVDRLEFSNANFSDKYIKGWQK